MKLNTIVDWAPMTRVAALGAGLGVSSMLLRLALGHGWQALWDPALFALGGAILSASYQVVDAWIKWLRRRNHAARNRYSDYRFSRDAERYESGRAEIMKTIAKIKPNPPAGEVLGAVCVNQSNIDALLSLMLAKGVVTKEEAMTALANEAEKSADRILEADPGTTASAL